MLERFAWPRIIAAYEALWIDQERQRRDYAQTLTRVSEFTVPAHYPPPERSFAGYPSRWIAIGDDVQVVATSESANELPRLLALPLTNHVAERRVSDFELLSQILERATGSCPIAAIEAIFQTAGVDHQHVAGYTCVDDEI